MIVKFLLQKLNILDMRMILKITPPKTENSGYEVFLHFWPFWKKMGSKSHLIIGQKSGENARYYRCVLRKKIDFWGFGCGILCICDTFWIQNHTRYHSKELKSARWGGWMGGLEQLWHLLSSKSRLIVGQKSWREGGRVLSICGTFWDQIHNWLLAKKTRKMLKGGEGILRICDTFWVQNPTKKSKKTLNIISAL